MGQISDREGAFSINNVRIEQSQPDGSWKQLGSSDGNGRWWIIKEKLKGGGNVRLSKPGYYPVVMSEAEFLQQVNVLMTPTESRGGGFGESSRPFDPAGQHPSQ